MPVNDDDWTLNEWRSDNTPEVRLFRKNLSTDVAGFRRTHSHLAYFTFTFIPKDESGLPTPADFDRLAVIEETEVAFLIDGELAAFVAVVTVPGIRDFLFYTHSPELFLERAKTVRDRHPEFQSGCQISSDPKWSQYDDLP